LLYTIHCYQVTDLVCKLQCHTLAYSYKERCSKRCFIRKTTVTQKVLHVDVLGNMLYRIPISQVLNMLYDHRADNDSATYRRPAFITTKHTIVIRNNLVPWNGPRQLNPTIFPV